MGSLNVAKIRRDFPVLKEKEIIYLDNACMTLRPKQVIDAIKWYYENNCACSGRSLHKLSEELNENIALARETIKKFFNAHDYELIFTKNTTEAINTVAFGMKFKRGAKVITSDREHNSNLVPWLVLRRAGVKHFAVPSAENFEFNLESLHKMLDKKVKLVSVVHISNIDGYRLPIEEIIKLSHDFGAKVLVDGAQSAGHIKVDLKKLDPDFFTISAHKACGPIIGCLFVKKELVDKLKPLIYGGGTVSNTTLNSFKLINDYRKFEAGLQDYAGIIGFGEACNYLKKVGMKNIEKHEKVLTAKLMKAFANIDNVKLVGMHNPKKCSGIVSFNIEGLTSHDVALMLDEARNIAVRSGKHCAHAWFNKNRLPGCVRASYYLYNSLSEINALIEEVSKIAEIAENIKK
ncbi:MAG: cysteine desulfurase [Candidatus Diapherotrites archaeon]|nr:cysteine desulfurase [Candidatus Diapherotrites archaeon]